MDGINITEVMIGCQRSGKSWHAMQRAAEIASEYDCRIVIHDAGSAAIRKPNNPYHNSDHKIFTAAEPPTRLSWPDIVVVNTAAAEDVLAYADKIRRKGPVVVLIDEVTASRKITPTYIGPPWDARIAQRFAFKTALLLCMQSPTLASRFLTSTATKIKVFRLEHVRDLKELSAMRFTDDQIEMVSKLKRGQYIEKQQGFGSDE